MDSAVMCKEMEGHPSPGRSSATETPEVSIVMPCLNEARTLPACIRKAKECMERNGVSFEIVIADNGSTDGSQRLAEELGARVAPVAEKGYGAALRGGIEASRGRYAIMGDSDDSYDFGALMPLIEKLREGHQLVLGNRFKGGIQPGAMPFLHQYLGNPALTLLARLLFRVPCGDVYCGLRGFDREACGRLELQSKGMEFALEMIIKATMMKYSITEVPTTLSPDGRGRAPHLKTWSDGRRSFKLYCLCQSHKLFFFPGLLMALLGAALGAWLLLSPAAGLGTLYLSASLAFAGASFLLGFQAMAFSVYARLITHSLKIIPHSKRFYTLLKHLRLEYGLLLGAAFMGTGAYWTVDAAARAGGAPVHLDSAPEIKLLFAAVMAFVFGVQIVLSSMYLSLLKSINR